MAPPDDTFRLLRDVEVRFQDIDVGGHAHHAHVLVYFEEARAAYWREVVGRQGAGTDAIDYVLAEGHVRWHARILWPQTVSVGVRVSAMGKKHFRMEYQVRSAAGERLASGYTVQVMYDYQAGVSKPIPDPVRAAIADFEGPLPSRLPAADR